MIQPIADKPRNVMESVRAKLKTKGKVSRPAISRLDILAAGRTAMAADRSFKNWTVTGITLIAFGFTIYQYILSLSKELTRNDALGIGLFLIGIGTVMIMYGAAEYWENMRELHQFYGVQLKKTNLLFGLAVVGFGIYLFFSIIILKIRLVGL
jgi:uncharacterized membrane protein YidH (DUF202 family)